MGISYLIHSVGLLIHSVGLAHASGRLAGDIDEDDVMVCPRAKLRVAMTHPLTYCFDQMISSDLDLLFSNYKMDWCWTSY